MVKMGSSDDMGSWKIMAMSSPRMRRMARGESVVRSRSRPSLPVNRMSPRTRADSSWSSSRISARPMVDFPEPDSPTRATISPGATVKLTSRTACTIPSGLWKRTSRPETSRIGAVPVIGPHRAPARDVTERCMWSAACIVTT